MVNQTHDNIVRNKSNSPEQNAQHAARRTSSSFNSNFKSVNDEVISLLSDAYENQRAQQVHEWEMRQYKSLSA